MLVLFLFLAIVSMAFTATYGSTVYAHLPIRGASMRMRMLIIGALLSVPSLMQAQEGGDVVETASVYFDWSSQLSPKTLQPEFAQGMLFVRHMDGPSGTTYSAYARDGHLVSRFRIDVPGVQQTIGSSMAPLRGANGYVAVAIAVQGSERTATLCFLDTSGKLLKIVKTSPFWPYLITVADDGTIWAFGAPGSDEAPGGDASLVYQFSSAGELLGTAVPRRLFGQAPPFELSPDLGVAALASGGNRVVLYSPHTYQLLELTLDRSIVGSYTIKPPDVQRAGQKISEPMKLMGLAVTGHGAVYARLTGGASTGIYELDRAAKRWVPLPAAGMDKVRAYSLIGSTGDELALIPAGPRQQSVDAKWIRIKPRFTP